MKIEKVNDNKLRITLSIDELSERNINIKDIKDNSEETQEFFWTLIGEAELQSDFNVNDSQLFVEAYTTSDDNFVMVITKVDTTNFVSKRKKGNELKNKGLKISKNSCEIHIVIFNHFDSYLEFCNLSKNMNLYVGVNTIYKYNNLYYLVFSKSTVQNPKFKNAKRFISEFGEFKKFDKLFEAILKEKGSLLSYKKAIQKTMSVL